MYTARREDCQECPIKNECLPPRQRRRYVSLTRYYPMSLLARKRNQTDEYPRERVRRQTIAEGAFASLDRLGWARTRLRGLWKVDYEGYMASFGHNVLKMVRKLGAGIGPPGPMSPDDANAISEDHATGDAVMNSIGSTWCLASQSWLAVHLKPALRYPHLQSADFFNKSVNCR